MKQDKKFIEARDRVRNYIQSRHYKKKSTIIKMNGWVYNGQQDNDLNQGDLQDMRSAIESARAEILDNHENGLKVIAEFEEELNRVENGMD